VRDDLFPRALTSQRCHQIRAMFERAPGSIAMILLSSVPPQLKTSVAIFYSRTASSNLFHKIVIENEALQAGRQGIFSSISSLLGA